MKSVKKILMPAALVFVVLLVVLLVAGAFVGSTKARQFFNTLALTVYWLAFLVMLIAGIANFRRLRQQPFLLAIHLSIILIFIGGMWSSKGGHRLSNKLFGIKKMQSGYMGLAERMPDDRLFGEDLRTEIGRFAFKVNLLRFWLEYYRSGPATISGVTPDGSNFTFELPDKLPMEFDISEDVKLTVVRKFENLRVDLAGGQAAAIDRKGAGENPAVEIEIATSDGFMQAGFLFEKFPRMNSTGREFDLAYSAGRITGISDYKSHVQIVSAEGAKPLLHRIIEVNKPLYFGGYHFYQHSYDSQNLSFTVLAVVSDSGLYLVYVGFWLLGLAVLGLFWIRPVVKYFKINKWGLNEH